MTRDSGQTRFACQAITNVLIVVIVVVMLTTSEDQASEQQRGSKGMEVGSSGIYSYACLSLFSAGSG